MANPQTAEEWKTVAAEYQARLDKNTAEQAVVNSEFAQAQAAKAEARAALDAAVAATGSLLSPEAKALRSVYNKANSEFNTAETRVKQYREIVDANKSNLANANTQAEKALTGPPQTSPNTPPATDKPNTAATDVPPTPIPPAPEVTDPPPDPADDPYETARLAAEEQSNVPASEIVLTPDEQAAADDPFEQRRLELEQQANRDELAREENLNVGDSDPTTFPPSGDFAFNPDEEEERTNLNAAIKQGTLDKARAQNTIANQRRNPNNGDWRVKLRLAPGANYLYQAPEPGILQPLAGKGIIFPYTPTIATSYKANYASYDLTHSNYKSYYYQSSTVEPVTLSCPFTAQSTPEAEYLLAVIHFFKSVTKMFYGQDAERGTPPPLVYLTGLGEFQFNEHPCVVQSFTYDLPADVDYIRARSQNVNNSNMLSKRQSTNATGPGTTWGGGILGNVLGGAINRLANAGLPKGGMNKPPAPASFGQNSPTYVPTKMTISISLLPVQSRKQVSQNFSLRQYANGDLLKGGFW